MSGHHTLSCGRSGRSAMHGDRVPSGRREMNGRCGSGQDNTIENGEHFLSDEIWRIGWRRGGESGGEGGGESGGEGGGEGCFWRRSQGYH
jgi:hypothetical protein